METNIVAYGGSIIMPGETYDEGSLLELLDIIRDNNKSRFVFIIGGGKLCRNINLSASKHIDKAIGDESELCDYAYDELGIACTKINAEYARRWLSSRLGDETVYGKIIYDPYSMPDTDKRVIIASGYRPGVTTDYDMMRMAKTFQASRAFKISNFPILLDVEPTKFEKEKLDSYEKIPLITWEGLVELLGPKHIPGGNYPMDPKGAALGLEMSEENKEFSLFIGCREEFRNMLEDGEFYGTEVRG